MLPSTGRTVLYFFTAYRRHGSPELELRYRPAIVQSVTPDGAAPFGVVCNLRVFFEDSDAQPWQNTPFVATPSGNVIGVPGHITRDGGELGMISGSRPPLPNTWAWPTGCA